MTTWRRPLCLIHLAWCVPSVAQDAPATTSYGIETAFRSGHSDRGFLISDRPVFQPVVWVSWRGTESYVWGSLALDDATDGSRPGILEAELAHKFEWTRVSIRPAARMWFYHDRVSRSHSRSLEAWLNVSTDLGPITLFTSQSVDVLDYRGGYFGEAGIESERNVSPHVEIGGSLGAGWANSTFNDYWAGVAKSAFNRVSAEGWLTLYPNPHFYIVPHVEFSSIVDRDVRAGDLYSPTYFLFRLTAGVEF